MINFLCLANMNASYNCKVSYLQKTVSYIDSHCSVNKYLYTFAAIQNDLNKVLHSHFIILETKLKREKMKDDRTADSTCIVVVSSSETGRRIVRTTAY